ncbi:MAG TPA: hypothetical protein VN661_02690 [Candidatus Acidoferrales bacterium]|nr:hypothetical protein [Candidatus Acidoferrales bacterium]
MVLAVAALLLQLNPVTPGVLTKISATAPSVTFSSSALRFAEPAKPEAVAPALDATANSAKLLALANDTSDGTRGTAVTTLPAEPSQNMQSLSNIRIPPTHPPKRMGVPMAERPASRRQWMILSAVQSGAAAFDAYSTRQAIATGAVEKDPMMRPFANSAAIYGAIQVTPIVLDYFARRMQRSNAGLERRLWWVPQALGTATFIFSGVHNVGVASRR